MPHIVYETQKRALLTALNQKPLDWPTKTAAQHRNLYLGSPDFKGFDVVL